MQLTVAFFKKSGGTTTWGDHSEVPSIPHTGLLTKTYRETLLGALVIRQQEKNRMFSTRLQCSLHHILKSGHVQI